MKKGKVLGKGQVIAVLMVIALGAAIWLNMELSSSEKYLGEAKYVNNSSGAATQTSTNVKESETDYFKAAIEQRNKANKEAQELIDETLKSENLTEEDKKDTMLKVQQLASRIEQTNNIETLLKAKGFTKAVAIIGDKNINIVVKSDGLTTAQTLQIQDIVTSETDVALGNIKIVTVS